MTETTDYPDFIRPVASAETDEQIFQDTNIAPGGPVVLGAFDVSQVEMLRGLHDWPNGSGLQACLIFRWKISGTTIGEDHFLFTDRTDAQFGGPVSFGVRPRGPQVTVLYVTSNTVGAGSVTLFTSTRPGQAREITYVNGAGRVLLDRSAQLVTNGGSFVWNAPPAARAIDLRAAQGAGPGLIQLQATYYNESSFGLVTLGKWPVSGTADLVVPGLKVPPSPLTVTAFNNDTASRLFAVQITDVS